jgi:hypothetical protein
MARNVDIQERLGAGGTGETLAQGLRKRLDERNSYRWRFYGCAALEGAYRADRRPNPRESARQLQDGPLFSPGWSFSSGLNR